MHMQHAHVHVHVWACAGRGPSRRCVAWRARRAARATVLYFLPYSLPHLLAYFLLTTDFLLTSLHRLDKAMVPMAVPGTIDATMQRALAHFPQYTPSVLHRDPWILHFESFLNDEEVDP